MTPLKLHFAPLLTLVATVAPAIDFGAVPVGRRRVVPITGGHFSGDRLDGIILAGGSDIQTIRGDGTAELAVNAILETTGGVRILLKGHGIRHAPPAIAEKLARGESPDPASYYFREAVTFDVASGALDWLNRLLAIGVGRRNADTVELTLFEIL